MEIDYILLFIIIAGGVFFGNIMSSLVDNIQDMINKDNKDDTN